MAMTPSERQARYRERLRKAADPSIAYEVEVLQQQVSMLEQRLNETRKHIGLPEIAVPKSAYRPQD